MNPHALAKRRIGHQHGFTVIELLVVVAIIMIMAAVMIPNIAGYLRNYQIKGAAQEVAGQLQQARSKAITKNVSLGVVWALVDAAATQSQVVVEDDLKRGDGNDWLTIPNEDFSGTLMNTATNPEQTVSAITLPGGVQFDDPANCPGVPAGTPNWGLRFNRLGVLCEFTYGCGGAPAPPNPPPGPPRISFNAGTATICLLRPRTGLHRTVTVTAGGRALAQP